jgi:myo-inositol-1(or 4)-monophosphatase
MEQRRPSLDSQKLLEVALDAARAAVEVHRRHAGRVRVEEWATKGVADFVTHVDREAEAVIAGVIRSAFPAHSILAEEEATAGGAAPAAVAGAWNWIVDPLDGTTNYLHGYPAYAASVAVVHEGTPVAGAVVHGATGEAWWATAAGGAFHEGRRITVSGIDEMAQALVGTGFPFKALELLPEYAIQFQRVLAGSAGIRRAGSAALDLCHVASGWFDGFWELSLAPWDVAAGVLLVREAGGVVTRLDGAPEVIGHGSILAGNPVVHRSLGALVRGGAERDGRVNEQEE